MLTPDTMDQMLTHIPTILVVDDTPENVLVLKGILADLYRIKVATNGIKALEIAESARPDIILLDIMMPGMDGYEVCRLLKQNDATRDIPVIFITALNESVNEEMGFDAGCVDYITKPISPSITLARVKTHLELRRAARVLAREQALAAQKESLDNLTLMANSIPALIAHVDTRQRYLYVNKAYAQWVGHSEEDIIGRHISEIMPEDTYRFSAQQCERVLSGHPCFLERTVVVEGKERIHYVSFVPQFNDKGDVRAYFALVTDLTELRHITEQLRHAQKMDAMGQLAAGVAHDFNNILSVISGYCQLIKFNMDADDPHRPDLEQVIDAAERAAHLTETLLSFSRKEPPILQPIDLNPLFCHAEKYIRRIIGDDIQVRVSPCEQSLTVLADSGQIDQILLNLAANARDAMPAGGTLSLSLGLEDMDIYTAHLRDCRPGRYAVIAISDNGLGIDGDTLKHIFEPFFTTKPAGKGTGLGLTIVYGIVKQHNGFISVSSESGSGTRFEIRIPLHELESNRTVVVQSAVPCGGHETILVADDDATISSILSQTLSKFGYTLLMASNGLDAVALFEQQGHRIDLVILDVLMPVMNGKEAAQRIKQLREDIKILFISGYTPDIIRNRGAIEAQDEIFMKPIRPVQFLEKIRQLLDRNPIRRYPSI